MPAPTPCPLPALIEKINSMRPSKEQAASFKAILTDPNHCGKEVEPALQWARALNAPDTTLPTKNGDLIQLISVPLLVWGLRQPWAETISASHVVNFWFKYQDRSNHMQEQALAQAWATHAVRLCAQDPQANRTRAEDLCRVWVDGLNTSIPFWQWESIYSQNLPQVYDGWLDMGRLALPDLRDLARPEQTLQDNWRTHMAAVLKRMPVPEQSDVLIRLLTSDIPDPLKIAVAKKAESASWLDPRVYAVLRPMLPPQDHTCYQELPWTKQTGHVRAETIILANQSVANLYCPTLLPAFSLMLSEEDWTDREAVCRVANAGRVGKKLPQEFPIGDFLVVE